MGAARVSVLPRNRPTDPLTLPAEVVVAWALLERFRADTGLESVHVPPLSEKFVTASEALRLNVWPAAQT